VHIALLLQQTACQKPLAVDRRKSLCSLEKGWWPRLWHSQGDRGGQGCAGGHSS